MSDEMKADAILAALPWRCFCCDFVTSDHAEAAAHFGDRDDASEFKPICRWWSSMDAEEKIGVLQQTIMDLNSERNENMSLRTAIEGLEHQVTLWDGMFSGYKPFRECHSIYEVFCVYDSMEGRALAAEAKLAELTSPPILPQVTCGHPECAFSVNNPAAICLRNRVG